MGKREPMASSRDAAEPAVSGAIIEIYARQTGTGATVYAVEVGGLPVAEGIDREFLAGVYLFLKQASGPVVSAVVDQVLAAGRTPLEV